MEDDTKWAQTTIFEQNKKLEIAINEKKEKAK